MNSTLTPDLHEFADLGPDRFDQAYACAHDEHRAAWAWVAAWACALVALFAFATSLPALRVLALGMALVPIPLLLLSWRWRRRGPNFTAALRRGAIATTIAWLLVAVACLTPGLRFGFQRDLRLLAPPDSAANAAASKDSEQDIILRRIEAARAKPSAASFRALLPYLDRDQTSLILADGSVRSTSSLVREVLHNDKELLYRSLDAEARSISGLLPNAAAVPRQMTIDVVSRLEYALKNLISFHSEQKITNSFDVPSVGINIRVLEDTGEDTEKVSNREIGITYPYGEVMPGDTVFLDAATVDTLLNRIRKDLGY